MNIEFARQQMVKQQVRAWDVLDENVLDVFTEVLRENFVPPRVSITGLRRHRNPFGTRSNPCSRRRSTGRVLQALKAVGGREGPRDRYRQRLPNRLPGFAR